MAESEAGSTPVDGVPAPDGQNTEQVVVAGAHSSDALRVGDIGEKQRPGGGVLQSFANVFLPNRQISPAVMAIVAAVEAGIALLIWITSPYKVLPRPGEVLGALQSLWLTQGLGQELATSFKLNLEALAWSSLISLGLAYLTVLPLFRPLVAAIARGRFMSLTGLSLIFILMARDGHQVKVLLLVFGITVFYITSMASVIAAIPKGEFDHARTLRMSEWRVVWEVVILGTINKAFEVLRQNAAIGWMMLTMVEGIVRQEGGLGKMLLDHYKHFIWADLFAIQLLILIVGLFQDYFINLVRRLVCPYADLTLERK